MRFFFAGIATAGVGAGVLAYFLTRPQPLLYDIAASKTCLARHGTARADRPEIPNVPRLVFRPRHGGVDSEVTLSFAPSIHQAKAMQAVDSIPLARRRNVVADREDAWTWPRVISHCLQPTKRRK